MQGQVLMVVPSTFSLTLLWTPRKVQESQCSECSFHYFVTSKPSLAAKMAQHVQPGPAFAQKGEEFGFEIENVKWKLIWARGGARLMVAITNS